jgi:hypothetical protein
MVDDIIIHLALFLQGEGMRLSDYLIFAPNGQE